MARVTVYRDDLDAVRLTESLALLSRGVDEWNEYRSRHADFTRTSAGSSGPQVGEGLRLAEPKPCGNVCRTLLVASGVSATITPSFGSASRSPDATSVPARLAKREPGAGLPPGWRDVLPAEELSDLGATPGRLR